MNIVVVYKFMFVLWGKIMFRFESELYLFCICFVFDLECKILGNCDLKIMCVVKLIVIKFMMCWYNCYVY